MTTIACIHKYAGRAVAVFLPIPQPIEHIWNAFQIDKKLQFWNSNPNLQKRANLECMEQPLILVAQQLLVEPQCRLKTLKAHPLVDAMKPDGIDHGTELDDIGGYLIKVP